MITMTAKYESYEHWRAMMTETAGIALNRDYCEERIAVLEDDEDASTRVFLKTYGSEHRDQIVGWFRQALAES